MSVLEAARALAAARVRFSESFLRWRIKANSDGQAERHAIVETKDEITVLEAELRVALYALEYDLLVEVLDESDEPGGTTTYTIGTSNPHRRH